MKVFGKTTLIKKLLAFYMMIVAVSFYFMLSFGRRYAFEKMESQIGNSLLDISKTLVNSKLSEQSYDPSTLNDLKTQFEIAAKTSDCRIMVILSDGDILLDTKDANIDTLEEEKTAENTVNNAPSNIYMLGNADFLNNTFTYDSTMNGLLSSPSLVVSVLLERNPYLNGHLVMSQGNSIILTKADYYYNIILNIFYIVLGLLLLTYIGIYFFCFVPLKKLRNECKDFAIGRDNPPISINTNDEYGELAQTLNVIGSELGKFDEYQRKFLSNISHDFRSPLTSIHGYAQAFYEDVIPPDQQKKYLQIIISETDRLTKLTNEIMELNSLDKNYVLLDISVFDPADIINDTAKVLDNRARLKNITIRTVLPEEKKVTVCADKSKIHQVLYNLVDNAIKFSKDGGTIEIIEKIKRDKVFISVKDDGIGIPKDDLSKIWDRFYKTDLSRGKDKRGSGLGLSICKEIIAAHKQSIDVTSTENVGTTFTFTLKKPDKKDMAKINQKQKDDAAK